MIFAAGCVANNYQAYRRGHKVTIHKTDGTTVVQHFALEDGAVMLEPDVRAHFPDSEAVNKRLTLLDSVVATKTQSKSESLTCRQESRRK